MRKNEIEAKVDKLATDVQALWKYAFRPSDPPSVAVAEVVVLRREVKELRDLLDEVIEPGYVLSKKADRGLDQKWYGVFPGLRYDPATTWFRDWPKPNPKPSSGTYEIRRRISNELIATFQNREDADVFIEALDGPTVDETGEVTE